MYIYGKSRGLKMLVIHLFKINIKLFKKIT